MNKLNSGARAAVTKTLSSPTRAAVQKDLSQTGVLKEISAAVNPSWYKNFIEEMQWIDTVSRKPRFRNNPDRFVAVLEVLTVKYMDRAGDKAPELQEFLKAKWYMDYLCAFLKNDKRPILADDVAMILAS